MLRAGARALARRPFFAAPFSSAPGALLRSPRAAARFPEISNRRPVARGGVQCASQRRCRGCVCLRSGRVTAAHPTCLTHTRPAARAAVLDASAQTLFLTEMFRGMALTLRYFFEPKVTVRPAAGQPQPPRCVLCDSETAVAC